MEIRTDPKRDIEAIKEVQKQRTNPEASIEQLLVEENAYLNLFEKMFANTEQLDACDFLLLNLQLGQLEAQAMQTREAIRAIGKNDPNYALELKTEYDDSFDELYATMVDLIVANTTELRGNLEKKTRDVMANPDISQASTLDLEHGIQQFNLLVRESNEQVRRIQLQRLIDPI